MSRESVSTKRLFGRIRGAILPAMARRYTALLLAFLVFGVASAFSQGILPGYSGVFSQTGMDILDFATLPRARIGELRNELYARYGRPFVSQLYRDFFSAKP